MGKLHVLRLPLAFRMMLAANLPHGFKACLVYGKPDVAYWYRRTGWNTWEILESSGN